ncbi:S-adenosyl-L-methionine-dependent methyltransferase [Rhizodiscina lignyota]|uniref:S-adenosyl-L-methionine-dependent methyltransferase n=1 Tax=Rhizodiscina lignyota TaxID=1504668 RepID=A0A9P4MA36_9PEZI|nr:S-adenosyl-L-methionine-dependent methyltransferase [Rhizodiscina lignyota]
MGEPKKADELAFASYWDKRYETGDHLDDQPTHEWFRGFDSLKPWLSKHLFDARPAERDPVIIHLGCGDSTIPHDLHVLGYSRQICVDFSAVVIQQMRERYADDSGIEWKCADVRALPEPAGSVDVAFDKGTLDAMIFGSPWDPPETVMRILKDDGIFLYVTYRQPHFVRPLLNRHDQWDVVVETLSDGDGSFEYYAFVLRKKLPQDAGLP